MLSHHLRDFSKAPAWGYSISKPHEQKQLNYLDNYESPIKSCECYMNMICIQPTVFNINVLIYIFQLCRSEEFSL